MIKDLVKRIYVVIPGKYFVFTILKKVFSFKFETYQHFHFKGAFKVQTYNGKEIKFYHFGGYTHIVESCLFWAGINGFDEKDSLRIWEKLSENSSNIFDIGANTGVYALVAAKSNKKAKVYAFDPVKRTYNKLVKNIKLNGLENQIIPIEKAASNYNGTGKIYDLPIENIYSVTVNSNLHDKKLNAVPVEIDLIKLSDFIVAEEIGKIDLIKIDVESHEPEVLEGMSDHIALFKPTILVEVWNDDIAVKIEQIVKNLDYLIFDFDEINGPVRLKKMAKSSKHNILLIQKNQATKVQLID